jgi:hypothetical protein
MAGKNGGSFKKVRKEKDVRGTAEQMEHADCIAAALEKWEKMTPKEKELYADGMRGRVRIFLQWWDCLKAIEEKYDIKVMDIAKEVRRKHSIEHGQRLAKKSKGHGIRDLYNVCLAGLEGMSKGRVWFELNNKRLQYWVKWCPPHQYFKEFGRSDKEIKELAEFYCLQDEAILRGFNPKLEVYDKPRIIMRGDSHCSYIVEDHGGE